MSEPPIAAAPIVFVVVLNLTMFYFTFMALCKKFHWTEFSLFKPEMITNVHVGFRKHGWMKHALYVFRFLIMCYGAGVELYVYISSSGSELTYYTIWNFSLLTIVFMTMFFLTTLELFKLNNSKWYRNLSIVCSVLYEMEFSCAVLVDCVLWLILYLPTKPADLLEWTSFVQHASNVGIFLIDFFFSDIPFRPFSSIWQLYFPLLYAYFAWIFFAETNFWAYFFLELNVTDAIGWYILVVVMHTAAFFLIYGLYRLKLKILKQKTLPQQLKEGLIDEDGNQVGGGGKPHDMKGSLSAKKLLDHEEQPNGDTKATNGNGNHILQMEQVNMEKN